MAKSAPRTAVRVALPVAVWALTLLAALTVTAAHPTVVVLLVGISAWLVGGALAPAHPRPFEETTMRPTLPTAVLVVVALVVTSIGATDAALSGEEDLFVVLALLAVLHLLLLTRLRGGRQPVPVRADLVTWLRARSAVSGEPVEVLADRALATYRAWYGDEQEAVAEVVLEPR